jgi:hypothetical protein
MGEDGHIMFLRNVGMHLKAIWYYNPEHSKYQPVQFQLKMHNANKYGSAQNKYYATLSEISNAGQDSLTGKFRKWLLWKPHPSASGQLRRWLH